MSRIAIATALSAALISLTALEAAAGPAVGSLLKTYSLQCSAGQNDGESLKANMTIIRNTTDKMIAKDTKITITYRMQVRGPKGPRFVTRTVVETAYRDIAPGATIPMGSSRIGYFNASSCTASVQLANLNTKVIIKRS